LDARGFLDLQCREWRREAAGNVDEDACAPLDGIVFEKGLDDGAVRGIPRRGSFPVANSGTHSRALAWTCMIGLSVRQTSRVLGFCWHGDDVRDALHRLRKESSGRIAEKPSKKDRPALDGVPFKAARWGSR